MRLSRDRYALKLAETAALRSEDSHRTVGACALWPKHHNETRYRKIGSTTSRPRKSPTISRSTQNTHKTNILKAQHVWSSFELFIRWSKIETTGKPPKHLHTHCNRLRNCTLKRFDTSALWRKMYSSIRNQKHVLKLTYFANHTGSTPQYTYKQHCKTGTYLKKVLSLYPRMENCKPTKL